MEVRAAAGIKNRTVIVKPIVVSISLSTVGPGSLTFTQEADEWSEDSRSTICQTVGAIGLRLSKDVVFELSYV